MKPNSRSSSTASRALALGLAALTALAGCESLQKKFIRKSKKPKTRPSPITRFEDYSGAMTPVDRYRKHYTLFQFWNEDLLSALTISGMNPKRVKKSSGEALSELRILQGLLVEGAAPSLERIIADRERLDRQLQAGTFAPSQVDAFRHQLDGQTRQIHRELFWRDVQDRLKPADAPAGAAASQTSTPIDAAGQTPATASSAQTPADAPSQAAPAAASSELAPPQGDTTRAENDGGSAPLPSSTEAVGQATVAEPAAEPTEPAVVETSRP